MRRDKRHPVNSCSDIKALRSRSSTVPALLEDRFRNSASAALLRDEAVTSDFYRTKVGPRTNAGRTIAGPRLL